MELHKVGTKIYKNARHGGGEYVVIGHVNCSRCNEVTEEREVIQPSKKHRQAGGYYYHFVWCWNCGLFVPDLKSRVNLKEVPNFIK